MSQQNISPDGSQKCRASRQSASDFTEQLNRYIKSMQVEEWCTRRGGLGWCGRRLAGRRCLGACTPRGLGACRRGRGLGLASILRRSRGLFVGLLVGLGGRGGGAVVLPRLGLVLGLERQQAGDVRLFIAYTHRDRGHIRFDSLYTHAAFGKAASCIHSPSSLGLCMPAMCVPRARPCRPCLP
jgi:uncharacterized membrane protein YfcA